jgi:plasmid stability protein
VQTFQIRNFPDDLKERLRARAAQSDLTMSDYVIQLIRADLDKPTMKEWLARLEKMPKHPELNLTGARALEEARAEAGLDLE